MAALIQRIAKQAAETFQSSQTLAQHLEKLEHLLILVQKITPRDLGLSNDGQDAKRLIPWAPVTYVDIYEGERFTLGVFILHPEMSLPLHDHPGMSGVCKMLFGKMKLTSYEGLQTRRDSPYSKYVQVKKIEDEIITPQSPCKVILPTKDVYHSMKSTDGPAAFFDVLSPPYDPAAERNCRYYRELTYPEHMNMEGGVSKEVANSLKPHSLTWLTEVPLPIDYYCNSLPYTGPNIDKETTQ